MLIGVFLILSGVAMIVAGLVLVWQVYGGRVICCDGTRCLVCLPEVLDQEQMRLDRLDPDLLEADRRIYGVDRDSLARSGPSVVSINGVVASLAVTEFVVAVTGLRDPVSQLTYRADQGGVRASKDVPSADCYYCAGLWGTSNVDGDGETRSPS